MNINVLDVKSNLLDFFYIIFLPKQKSKLSLQTPCTKEKILKTMYKNCFLNEKILCVVK